MRRLYLLQRYGNAAGQCQTGAGSGADAQGDKLMAIENLEGSALADALTGDDLANVLVGGGGDDTMAGGRGDDTAA